MSYAVRNDGRGWRACAGPADVRADETYTATFPGHIHPSQEELDQAAADAQAIADARADAVVQQLVSHSSTQVMQYVRNQVNANGVTNLATAKASIDALETMVAKLAVALGAALRDKLR